MEEPKNKKRRHRRSYASQWRGRIHASVVDLRASKKGETPTEQTETAKRQKRDAGQTKGKITPTEPPKEVQEYIQRFQGHRRAVDESPENEEYVSEDISAEAVAAGLAYFDRQDTQLQRQLQQQEKESPRPAEDVEEHPQSAVPTRETFIPKHDPAPLREYTPEAGQETPEPVTGRKERKAVLREQPEYDTRYSEAIFSSRRGRAGSPRRHRKRRYRKATLFLVLLAVLVGGGTFVSFKAVALKDEASVRAEVAYSHMQAGREALVGLQPEEAREHFRAAKGEFAHIEQRLGFLGDHFIRYTAKFPVSSRLSSAARLVRAGTLFSEAGIESSYALELVRGTRADTDARGDYFLTDKLVRAGSRLRTTREYIKEANTQLSHVRPRDIPDQFARDFSALQSNMGEIESHFTKALSSLDVLVQFLGHDEPKRYLFAFQNPSELRATGGFIGTYGTVTLKKGFLEDMLVDVIYNPDGQIESKTIPPKPLRYVTPVWETRDANWFFDFPTSARKVLSFYESALSPEERQQQKPDGVIAVTTHIVENLLELTGPIEMPEHGVTVTADNFVETTRRIVEENKQSENPRKILADLTPRLIKRANAVEQKAQLFTVLLDALESKDVMVYSREDAVQDFVAEHGWDGSVAETAHSRDYLAVVLSNIGGGKADRYTDTEIDTQTTIRQDGSITRTLLISRTHRGDESPFPWYRKANYGYVRIYVPEGAELISVEGFAEEPTYLPVSGKNDPLVQKIAATKRTHESSGTDIFQESGRTVFGNWMLVEPGERALATVKYRLPFSVSDNVYRLTLQKQAGIDVALSGAVGDRLRDADVDTCKTSQGILNPDHFRFTLQKDVTLSCSIR